MNFDVCLVSSWGETAHEQMIAWGQELADRDYQVALISPVSRSDMPSDIRFFSLPELQASVTGSPSPSELEKRYDLPSMDHLVFTERQYFNLSRTRGLNRGCRIAGALQEFFDTHSTRYTLQIRGPEIHRLLMHYMTETHDGISVWAGFSPFEGTVGLQTTLDGTWDTYETVPYRKMSQEERERTRTHIDEYLDERRFYTYDDDDDSNSSISALLHTAQSTVNSLVNRSRPGKRRDQVREELWRKTSSILNRQLLPGITESRTRCKKTDYLFFPLQYPIESRLTVFAPQFFRQESIIEYLSRILPSSITLFIKPHPHYPGLPDPRTVRDLQQLDRVQFLHPEFDAHTAIANSTGVLVTNNTIGVQTIYHRKPLFVLGTEFYLDAPAVTAVQNLGVLPEKISDCLFEAPSRQQVVSSLFSLREASYPGDRSDTGRSNVRELVSSFEQFIQDIS